MKETTQALLIQNQSLLDIDWTDTNADEARQWFVALKNLAQVDLSAAHIIQHAGTARLSVQLSTCQEAKLCLQHRSCDLGTSSVHKSSDTCEITAGGIFGRKNYISMLNHAQYHVHWIPDAKTGKTAVVFFLHTVDGYQRDNDWQPIGMEATDTGHIEFLGLTDFHLLFDDVNDPGFALRGLVHNLAFCTNTLGLCQALLQELQDLVQDKSIDIGRELTIIDNELKICEDLWSVLCRIDRARIPDQARRLQIHRLYSQGKKIMADLIRIYCLIGDSRHSMIAESSQRFRDALIYATHRQNFYTSLNKSF